MKALARQTLGRSALTLLLSATITAYIFYVFHDYPGQAYPIIVGIVAAVAWRLGTVYGMATLLTTAFGIDWYILDGPGLAISSPQQAAGLCILLAVGSSIAWSTSWLRRDRDKRIAVIADALAEARAGREQLAELMHRVQNDLSGLSSIARLKRNDPNAALDALARRTGILSRLYRRLALSGETGTSVDMELFLSGVVEDLQQSHEDSDDRNIAIRSDVARLYLPVKIAGVVALTVNEACMNAAKYARPDGGPCEVIVSLRRVDDGNCVLEIADDGVGPDGGPAKGTGMGTRLMRGMAAQIGGRYSMTREDDRTIVRLSFKA